MSKVLTDNQYYGQIADIIREQNGTSNTYTPPQMVSALKDLFYEEVEGVPPITFQGIGENLLDYRIDGASGGVGDLITDSTDENYNKYKVPVVISGKNLFDEENAVNTDYYITSTGQETVGANGDKFLKSHIYVNPSTQYTFKWSQTIMGSANNTPYIRISEYTSNNTFIQRLLCQCSAQSQNNYTFTTSNNTLYIYIIIDSETSTRGQHLTEIMLVKGATAPDTYEEYNATTTNIYLDKPIEAKANIPNEYEEVEYIESTGTQYINTNIIPTDTTGVEAKITICNDNNKDNIIMGCRETTSGENRYWIDVDWTTNDTIIFGFNNNTSANERYSLKGSDVGKPFIISMNYMNDRTGKINGITYDTSISSKTLVSISKPIYIFAGNRSGNVAYQYSGKLYNFKITNGTNVIRNFVPCYRNSDNVAGLYDLVNNVFYTNQGTGNFIVGPIKENKSISLSDTNVNIPTIRGTNVLSIDTTVQPSNVYVKSRHESSYEAAMRERYEEAQAQLDALESGGE